MNAHGVGRSQRIVVLAQLVRIVLFVMVTTLLGRGLTPADFGFVALVSSLFLAAHELMDMGTTAVASRQVAQAPWREREVLNSLFAWRRLVGLSLVFGLVALLLSGFVNDDTYRWVLAAAAVGLLALNRSAYYVVFQTRQAFGRASALGIGTQLAFLLSSAGLLKVSAAGWLGALSAGASLGLLVIAREIVQVLGSRVLAARMLGYRLQAAWLDPSVKDLIRSAWVFGAAGVAYKLSALMGSFLIWGLGAPEELGRYSAAQRLFAPLVDAAWLFASPLIAALSARMPADTAQRRRQLTALLQMMAACALGIALAGQFVARPVLQLLYSGQYSDGNASAVAIFQWLSLGFAFALMTPVLAVLALAQQREWTLLRVSAAGLAVTLIASGVLVTARGPVGAAVAWCAGEAVVFFSLLWPVVRRGELAFNRGWLPCLMPAACLFALLWLLTPWPWVQLPAAGIGLAASLAVLRALPAQRAFRAAAKEPVEASP